MAPSAKARKPGSNRLRCLSGLESMVMSDLFVVYRSEEYRRHMMKLSTIAADQHAIGIDGCSTGVLKHACVRLEAPDLPYRANGSYAGISDFEVQLPR